MLLGKFSEIGTKFEGHSRGKCSASVIQTVIDPHAKYFEQ